MKRITFFLLFGIILFTTCNKEPEETILGYDGIVVTILEDSDYNIVALSEDGEKICLKTDSQNASIEAVYSDEEDNTIVVSGDPEGRPTMMVINDFVFLFDNLKNNTCGVAMIAPDGTKTIEKEVSFDASYFTIGNKKSINPDGDDPLMTASKWLTGGACILGGVASLATLWTGAGAVAIGTVTLSACGSWLTTSLLDNGIDHLEDYLVEEIDDFNEFASSQNTSSNAITANATSSSDNAIAVIEDNIESISEARDEINPDLGNIIVTSPSKGDIWKMGNLSMIKWATGSLGGKVKIQLDIPNSLHGTITPNGTDNSGFYYDYEIQTTLKEGHEYRIKVTSLLYPDKYDYSEYFSIVGKLPEGENPIADFTASTTAITEGEIIIFSDQSTNAPTSWSWDFGDGGTSSEQSPSHIYSTAGTYTVELTATNNIGSDSESKTNYITVGEAGDSPIADFTASTTAITEGETITFSDQSTNAPTSWSWDFGDGGTGSDQNPTHSYSTAGTYTVELTATNNIGSDTEIKTNYIVVSEGGSSGEIGTVSDYDGNTYNTIQIGTQTWMAENLKTTHYANGTEIPLVENTTDWDNLGYTNKAMCYYDNSSTNANTYGALYTWAAAMNGANSSSSNPSNVQGVCPSGWHLPSDAEWKQLETYLGMSQADVDDSGYGYRGTNEGSKLAGNSGLWNDGDLENNAAFGTSGFTALPGGYRGYDGTFYILGEGANFWIAEEDISSYAWRRKLDFNHSGVVRYRSDNRNGFSVRCVKD